MTETSIFTCPCEVAIGDWRVVVRPLLASDREALEKGFSELSPRSRYYRFLTPMKELPERLARHLTDIDHDKHDAWVAGPVTEDGYDPVAVARYVRETAEDGAAEIALTVADGHQHKGLGSVLLYVLSESARSHGVRTFTALVHESNAPMRRFMKKFNSEVTHRAEGAIYFSVPVETIRSALAERYAFNPIEDH